MKHCGQLDISPATPLVIEKRKKVDLRTKAEERYAEIVKQWRKIDTGTKDVRGKTHSGAVKVASEPDFGEQ